MDRPPNLTKEAVESVNPRDQGLLALDLIRAPFFSNNLIVALILK